MIDEDIVDTRTERIKQKMKNEAPYVPVVFEINKEIKNK